MSYAELLNRYIDDLAKGAFVRMSEHDNSSGVQKGIYEGHRLADVASRIAWGRGPSPRVVVEPEEVDDIEMALLSYTRHGGPYRTVNFILSGLSSGGRSSFFERLEETK